MKCSHCGAEFEGNFCTACGAKAEPCPQPSPEIPTDRPRSQKPKKPIYKKWWFYVIVAVVVIAIAGRISGGSKSEKIDWDDMVLGAQLPQPPAKKGQIHTNTADELWVDIEKISDKQYADYVQACQTAGFTVDAESNSSSFGAYNAEGYKLELSYYGNREGLSIRLEKPMEMGPITWPDSEAGRQLPAPKSLTGKFSFEYDDNFFVYIGGTSTTGGTASIVGTIFGAIILVVIRQGLNLSLSALDNSLNATFITYAVTGVIVVAAVLLDIFKKKAAARVKKETRVQKATKQMKEQIERLKEEKDVALTQKDKAKASEIDNEIAALKANFATELPKLREEDARDLVQERKHREEQKNDLRAQKIAEKEERKKAKAGK